MSFRVQSSISPTSCSPTSEGQEFISRFKVLSTSALRKELNTPGKIFSHMSLIINVLNGSDSKLKKDAGSMLYKAVKSMDPSSLSGKELRTLIAAFKRINLPPNELIFMAIQSGNFKLAIKLINCIDLSKEQAATLLHSAVQNNRIEAVEALLKRYPSIVNEKSVDDNTPLMRACEGQDPMMVVRLLLQYGADPDIVRPENGQTALHIVCASQKASQMKSLLVRELINAGANVSIADKTGNTPLFSVASCPEVSKHLLEAGASVNIKNKARMTPLLIACTDPNVPALQLLLDHGADLNVRDKDDCTPLLLVVASKHPAAARFLVSKGVDMFEKFAKKKSPFEVCIENRLVDVLAAMLGKTNEYAAKYIDDYYPRQVLAHFNSIPNRKDYQAYESAHSDYMAEQWMRAIYTLPQGLVDQIGAAEVDEIIKAYGASTDRDPKYAPAIASNIQQGKLEMFPFGFEGHAMYAVFCNGYLVICNRGAGIPFPYTKTMLAYKIDLSKVTPEMIKELMQLSRKGDQEETLKVLYHVFPKHLASTRDSVCEQLEKNSTGLQHVGNCTSAAAKEAFMAAHAMLGIQTAADGSKSLSDERIQQSHRAKKIASAHGRAYYLDLYYQMHETGDPGVFDKHLADRCLEKTLSHLEKMGIDPANYERVDRHGKLLPAERRKKIKTANKTIPKRLVKAAGAVVTGVRAVSSLPWLAVKATNNALYWARSRAWPLVQTS